MKKFLIVAIILLVGFFGYSFLKKDKPRVVNVSELPEYLKDMADNINKLEVLVVKYEKLMKGATSEEKKKLGMEFQAEMMFAGIMENFNIEIDPKDMKVAKDLMNRFEDLGVRMRNLYGMN